MADFPKFNKQYTYKEIQSFKLIYEAQYQSLLNIQNKQKQRKLIYYCIGESIVHKEKKHCKFKVVFGINKQDYYRLEYQHLIHLESCIFDHELTQIYNKKRKIRSLRAKILSMIQEEPSLKPSQILSILEQKNEIEQNFLNKGLQKRKDKMIIKKFFDNSIADIRKHCQYNYDYYDIRQQMNLHWKNKTNESELKQNIPINIINLDQKSTQIQQQMLIKSNKKIIKSIIQQKNTSIQFNNLESSNIHQQVNIDTQSIHTLNQYKNPIDHQFNLCINQQLQYIQLYPKYYIDHQKFILYQSNTIFIMKYINVKQIDFLLSQPLSLFESLLQQ